MNNQDKNIRTLIVCFVIALVALIPLRIMESQNFTTTQDAAVLGEDTYNEEEQIYFEENYIEEEGILDEEIVLEDESEVTEEIIEENIVEEEIELPNAELE